METIGRIRRERFVKGKSIKQIARDLGLSRNTVRKVLRSEETSFAYEREVQPRPKLGRWTADLDRLLTANTSSSARERLDADPPVRGAAGSRLRGRVRRGSAICPPLERRARRTDSGGLRAFVVCAGRGLPVRLEPRGRHDERRDDHGEGRPHAALPQPDVHRPRLSIVRRRRWCSTRTSAPSPSSRAPARRHLRQHEDGGRHDLCRQGPPVQSPLPADVLHHLVDPVACTPASGWEKGQVENQVGLVRERFFTPRCSSRPTTS